MDFDFIDHRLYIRTSDGVTHELALRPRTVADFFAEYRGMLRSSGITPRIRSVPVEVETAIPFAEDTQHGSYDPEAVTRWWRNPPRARSRLQAVSGRLPREGEPGASLLGSFDLAMTRFSGRRAPPHPGGVPNCPDFVMHEAYSHECSSVGVWPGGRASRKRRSTPTPIRSRVRTATTECDRMERSSAASCASSFSRTRSYGAPSHRRDATRILSADVRCGGRPRSLGPYCTRSAGRRRELTRRRRAIPNGQRSDTPNAIDGRRLVL